jgi:hypothetical protein
MKLHLTITLTLFSLCIYAQQPAVFVMNSTKLLEIRKKISEKDPQTLALVASLQSKANALLSMKPLSVMDKGFTPVSGSKHDYMSQAPYFWYDSSKPNGIPYIRKDGEHNPEIKKITDHDNMSTLDNAVRILALTYYLSKEEKYAIKASSLLKYWFLDEATKMNPNLEYAQAIPGITTGRGIGIIESRSLIGIADAVGLLSSSKSWTTVDVTGIKNWYKNYLNWMLTSKNGKDEHAAKNNHGSWYYSQVIDFALFTGDQSKAIQFVNESKQRLDNQITEEGKWPLELERTNALGYSTMNTQAWFTVATLAEHVGLNLWNYTTSKNSGIRTAVDWLMPYALKESKWEYQQIGKYNSSEYYLLLLQAANKYQAPVYLDKIKQIKEIPRDPMIELLYH